MSHNFRNTTDAKAEIIQQKISQNHLDIQYSNYHYARSKDEWWKIVDNWWIELLEIAGRYLDLSQLVEPEFRPLYLHIEILKKDRNPKLADFFSMVWGAAPDSGLIHANKGWDVLCDLCSESFWLSPDETV